MKTIETTAVKGKSIEFENSFKNPSTSNYMGYIAFPNGIRSEKTVDFEFAL